MRSRVIMMLWYTADFQSKQVHQRRMLRPQSASCIRLFGGLIQELLRPIWPVKLKEAKSGLLRCQYSQASAGSAAGRPRLPVAALAAGETVSSNRPVPAAVSLNAATSDSISQVSPKIVVSALDPVAAHVNLLLCSPLSHMLSSASLKGPGQLWKPSQGHQKLILLVGVACWAAQGVLYNAAELQ